MNNSRVIDDKIRNKIETSSKSVVLLLRASKR